MSKKLLVTLLTSFTLALSLSANAAYPEKPIKIIVPFKAGGGSDAIARIFQQALEEQGELSVPVVVTNIAGPGGRIGSRRARDAEPDGYTMLLNHMTLLTSEATGLADYGYRDFETVAGTGDVCLVTAVKDSAPQKSLNDLLDAAKKAPESLTYGVNIGALNHMGGLLLQDQEPGAAFRFVQIGGDVANFTNLLGGHIDATSISAGQYSTGRESGLRGLAILADERHPDLPDLPTAKEQGVDLSFCFEYWWFVPKGTPADRVELLSNALKTAMDSERVQDAFRQRKTLPVFRAGADLDEYIQTEFDKLQPVAKKALKK